MTDDRPSIAELQRLYAELEDARGWQAECRQAELLEAQPALLGIVAAAIAYEQAKSVAAVVRRTFAADGRESMQAHVERHDRHELRCRSEYLAALAKVRS